MSKVMSVWMETSRRLKGEGEAKALGGHFLASVAPCCLLHLPSSASALGPLEKARSYRSKTMGSWRNSHQLCSHSHPGKSCSQGLQNQVVLLLRPGQFKVSLRWHSLASQLKHFSCLVLSAFYTTLNKFQGLPLVRLGLDRILMTIKSNYFTFKLKDRVHLR